MRQIWAVLTISALAQMAPAATFAQTAPETTAPASPAPLNPQLGEKPAILLPNGTKDTQYDLNFGFPDRSGPFSAMLVVIPKAELEEFNKPGGVRHLNRVARAEAGAVLAIKIMVTGSQSDANGVAKVTSDLQVLAPSGEIYGRSDYKELPVWVGPVTKGVYDNRDRVVLIRFEPTDPPGVYTIKTVVHDRFGQRDIPLQTTVELLLPRQAAAQAAPESATATPQATETTPAVQAKPQAKAKSKRRRRH